MNTATNRDLSSLLGELRKSYMQDLPEKFDNLESRLLALNEPASYNEAFEDAYRIAHSLKGSAGTYDFHILTHICHQLEDRLTALSSMKQSTATKNQGLLGYIDLMREALQLARQEQKDFRVIEHKLGVLAQHNPLAKYSGMIVDSSDTSVKITKNIFQPYPISFVVETDGQTALQRLLHEPFNLLITSAELPSLNGIALIAAVRLSHSLSHNIPIILTTSNRSCGNQRNIDPNFIVHKDQDMIPNLDKIAMSCMQLLAKN